MYFLPEPQGQGALRWTRPQVEGSAGLTSDVVAAGHGQDPRGLGGLPSPGPAGAAAGVPRHADLEVGQHLAHRGPQVGQHALEQVEGLALVLVERVALAVAAQMDALPQMVEVEQMLLPLVVEDLQQDVLLAPRIGSSP